jgi:serine/threonine-protein kinase
LASELAHNAAARRRFAREAQAAAAVVHDHVVPIYAVDGSGPIPYLVMAYIPGYSLQERIEQTGPLEVREILRIGMQTAAGLAAAHAQGLVHRDIKPANILLENGVERVRITDFGLARAMDEASQTQSGILAGTPQYMAPEQACGESIDYRADLFSLGSVLYAMCTGHSPFRAETTVAVLRRICDGVHRPVREVNADVPDWLAAIIDKLLSKRPGDRYSSAEEVARLLAEHLAQLQHPLPRRWSPSRRLIRWAAGIAAALAAVVLIGFVVNQLRDNSKSKGSAPSATLLDAGASAKEQPVEKRPEPIASEWRVEADTFRAELVRIQQQLWRLESQGSLGDSGYSPANDPLRQVEARLRVLEHEIGALESPSKTSQP